ncbi:MAG: DUF1697 domain-containing protein [Gracilibacteraceae bacterium]|jgi:uncharacterized protein (DUF1697 family)|nr:DUF1697 domain-containing protein [Gracilibacteraceae bacterium]
MTYAALFRGINVGGKNIVKMVELRQLLSGLGFRNVKTYIQSGNAIFDSDDEAPKIKETIQVAFQSAFQFECAVILRTKEEIEAVIKSLPFSKTEMAEAAAANSEVEHLYYYFSDNPPGRSMIRTIGAEYGGPDKLAVGAGGMYLLCHESIRDSKLAAALVKQNFSMTARNWKTLTKLSAMMET